MTRMSHSTLMSRGLRWRRQRSSDTMTPLHTQPSKTGLPADHPFFGELIMGENLALADFYALAEKHSLWDEQLCRDIKPTQKKASDKPLNDKNKPRSRRKDRSLKKWRHGAQDVHQVLSPDQPDHS
ncbi:hypothetical protein ACFX2C_013586 [Malus domestica]